MRQHAASVIVKEGHNMNRILEASLLLFILVFLSSCKKDTAPVEPADSPLVDWEGHAPLFNESCRDSILAITSYGIVAMYKDGTGERILASMSDLGYCYFASWSPRKWKILYHTPQSINVMNADGSNRRLVAHTDKDYVDAKFSPDGQKLAYICIDSYGQIEWLRIEVMDPDGSNVHSLISHFTLSFAVSWTPDSKSIVYSTQDSTGGALNVVAVDGTAQRSLYRQPGVSCDWPSLSPDGTRIAFSTAADVYTNNFSIYLYDMRSSTVTQLTKGKSNAYEPTWSSNSSQIIFSSSGLLWRIDVDGNNQVCIAPDSLNHHLHPCWYKR